MSSAESQQQSSATVRLRGVWKHYRRGGEDIPAAADISLDLQAGTLTCILGPSGGGKSTLLHLMGGMDRPSDGEIIVHGRDITKLKSDALSAYRRRDVGFVFQAFHLLPGRTAAENAELPLAMAGMERADRHRRALDLLDRVGLRDRADHKPNQLSGGQSQRVAVARALAADPAVILADEPTGNLDSQSGREIMELLHTIAHEDGRTVVVVTHNEEFIPFADRIVRIRDGRVQSDERRDGAMGRDGGDHAAGSLSPAPRGVRFGTLAGMAVKAVRRRFGRATLTGLGIAIGVAATVLLMGVGNGLESGVVKSLTTFGPLTSITVSPQKVSGTSSPFAPNTVSGPTKPITPAALSKLAALPGARAAYASTTFFVNLQVGGVSTLSELVNLPPQSLNDVGGIRPTLKFGAWPQPGELLLSTRSADALQGGHKPNPKRLLGKRINVQLQGMSGGILGGGTGFVTPQRHLPTEQFRVAGIVTGNGMDYISYPSALEWVKKISGSGAIHYPGATVIANNISDVSALSAHIGHLGYGTTTVQQILKSITKGFAAVEAGLGVIGGIALVVAGLMISVIMSMSVLERRREIGILRAVGARKRDIARLFLTEVATIGLAGGVVGLGIGWGAGAVINQIVRQTSGSAQGIFHLPLWLIALALLFGVAVSLLAGWIPAARAARLNPVDALHTE